MQHRVDTQLRRSAGAAVWLALKPEGWEASTGRQGGKQAGRVSQKHELRADLWAEELRSSCRTAGAGPKHERREIWKSIGSAINWGWTELEIFVSLGPVRKDRSRTLSKVCIIGRFCRANLVIQLRVSVADRMSLFVLMRHPFPT